MLANEKERFSPLFFLYCFCGNALKRARTKVPDRPMQTITGQGTEKWLCGIGRGYILPVAGTDGKNNYNR